MLINSGQGGNMTKWVLVLILSLVSVPAFGQELISQSEEKTLRDWIEAVEKYQQWYLVNRNRIVYTFWSNLWGQKMGKRKKLPGVPEWLPDRCENWKMFEGVHGTIEEACNILVELESGFTIDLARQQQLLTQKQNEIVPHTTFWRRFHVDGPWTLGELGPRVWGLIGAHWTTIEIGKRTGLYPIPGFIMLSVPDDTDGREIRVGLSVGASFLISNFKFIKVPMKGHLNVANVSIQGGDPGRGPSNITIIERFSSWGQ